MVKPARLAAQDAVALLAPASPARTKALIARGLRSLRDLGFHPRLSPSADRACGYLAGSDRQRARDFRAAWTNPAIRAVFCVRGGYGSSRMLEQFDCALAARHPKVFVGFSDITTLHLALQAKAVTSFWGPMPGTEEGFSGFARHWLQKALMEAKPLGELPLANTAQPECLRSGRAQGRITGGTLSLLAASLGTPYEIETRGRIVFLEDVGEEPYRLDRMLTQLLAAGKLRDAAGIALGVFEQCEPCDARRSWSVRDVLADRLRPLKIPVFSGLAIGHIADQVTMPYGVLARLDAGAKRLEILESAVA